MVSEAEKYPPKIRKLFNPKLPFLHKRPTDYPVHQRSTPPVTPISDWRLHIEAYKKNITTKPAGQLTSLQLKQRNHRESMNRQLYEWEDTDAFAKNDFIKDPYKTVFVARLYYSLSELDLSKLFNRFGTIDSVRIIRDIETGKSRGYGFVVFEREEDAKHCIGELASTGLAVDPPPHDTKPRKILVDMERGRLARNWRPRRLGGGLGGRHYSTAKVAGSRDASAASSGRRLNLSANPYQGNSAPPRHSKRPNVDFHQSSSKRHNTSYASGPTPSSSQFSNSASPASSYGLPSSYVPGGAYVLMGSSEVNANRSTNSIKDKYARYQTRNEESSYRPTSGSGRSIRSIRQRE